MIVTRVSASLVVLLAAVAGRARGQVQPPEVLACPPDDPQPITQPGFLDEILVSDFVQAVGISFDDQGTGYVWERGGRVWLVDDQGLSSEPFLDISEEVGSWADVGMLGFALDPQFSTNGHVYALYAVDHHHLTHFGTPSYDPAADDLFRDTIGRLTRFTAVAADDFRSVDPASRLVLVGEDITSGFPICSDSHGVGSLVFGEDGSLLASCGDGDAAPTSQSCLAEGIIRPAEDVGRFRAQLVDTLSGKIVRLDPATGDGLPSNPFYDPAEPRAPRSRVWTLGLRQPFRMSLRPGTGASDPALGDPGTLYVGDVGQGDREELSVIASGGLNMGWPIHSGLELDPAFAGELTENLDAPNPLHGVGGCDQPFFFFQDLLVEDTLNTPGWPHPCDPGQPLVSGQPLFVHTRPAVDYDHATPLARIPVYDAFGEADVAVIGEPGTLVAGDAFSGNCAVGGVFYTGSSFPPQYHGVYFHGDFGAGWIRRLVMDPADTLRAVSEFVDPVGRVVALDVHPGDGSLWYVDLTATGASALHRIRHVPGNQPPTAVIAADVTWGPGPLDVTFDGSASSDPEGATLTYEWDFANGSPISRLPVARRRFPSQDHTATGTLVGRVFELVPPESMGSSNQDPEVMRDGVYPVLGTGDEAQQYDTVHFDENVLPDKGPLDWMGYTWDEPREFTLVSFQEGTFYGISGGWLDSLDVQVRQGGVWNSVLGAEVDPLYPGLGLPTFEIFEIHLPPTTGDGVRVAGPGGGTFEFFTVGELRAVGTPTIPNSAPVNFEVTLTVTDDAGLSDTATRVISLNNTPPVAQILSPANYGFYANDAPDVIDLSGSASDAEQEPFELDCAWQVTLHHDEHTHPGAVVEDCGTLQAVLSADGCPEVHFQEVAYTVTDPLGLSHTARHWLIPECDRNLNGVADVDDIIAGTSQDLDQDGVPDEAQADCDGDGVPDLYRIFFGESADVDEDGVPDECQNAWSDEGSALAGARGEPLLIGTGTLEAGTTNTLTLSDAAPAALAGLFFALSSTPVAFKGGTLVPFPLFIPPLIVPTDANGAVALPFAMPAAVPAGTELWCQWGVQDPVAIEGVALSNAVLGVTP